MGGTDEGLPRCVSEVEPLFSSSCLALLYRRSCLMCWRNRLNQSHPHPHLDKIVVNLSSRPLSDQEKGVLAKGLNFVPCPRAPPVLDIIASFEHGLSSIEQNRASEVKSAITNLLLRHRFTRNPNLDYSDMTALRNLRAENERMITKADKGNVVVVLDRSTYIEKMNHLLDSSTYCSLRSDPTDRTRKALRSLLLDYARQSKEDKLSRLANHLKYSSTFKCPEMYGLPKIDKPDIPFRPIVCSINSITYELSSHLKDVIQPLVRNEDLL
ncbi:hypothetical protein M513_07263 [Trichuris suis]|uniref:Uncharacterized protein n=1 Tax=Trichuris suis TaxID=68888 RepID=A0A085M3Y8_9BILA|nr:hypothetical protein M513_07263 [Trichuris suis]